jgi:hypothetical protein
MRLRERPFFSLVMLVSFRNECTAETAYLKLDTSSYLHRRTSATRVGKAQLAYSIFWNPCIAGNVQTVYRTRDTVHPCGRKELLRP